VAALVWALPGAFAAAACGTSSSGSVDAAADRAAKSNDSSSADSDARAKPDASTTGCDIQTCSGKVFVPAGSSVLKGDNCGTECTCPMSGPGLSPTGDCPFVSDCFCADAGK
jgi:hypothetical protein